VVYSSQSSTSISMFGASVPFCLIAPPTPTLFGVLTFHHRRSPFFFIGVYTPSIRCFYNSSISILACIGKVFACCLHQEYKRLPGVQSLHSLCSKIDLGTPLLLAPVVSLQLSRPESRVHDRQRRGGAGRTPHLR